MKNKYDVEDERNNIIIAIKRIAEKIGKTPTQKEYKLHRNKNELSLEQIFYRFSTYGNAVKEAGLNPNPFKKPPRTADITKNELINEYIRVSNELNKLPTNMEFRVNSKYSWTPYKTKWGSFKEATVFIIKHYHNKFNFKIEEYTHDNKHKDKNKKILDYNCNMLFEPSNEIETIALFIMLIDEFCYKIKKLQSDFPDAIIIDKNNNEILIEFEYLSSNYIQHCHPREFTGKIICWRKDIEIENIEILSLEEYIRKKRKNGI